jgi:hypothetical protein
MSIFLYIETFNYITVLKKNCFSFSKIFLGFKIEVGLSMVILEDSVFDYYLDCLV